jgi:hypothetical protein
VTHRGILAAGPAVSPARAEPQPLLPYRGRTLLDLRLGTTQNRASAGRCCAIMMLVLGVAQDRIPR